jgi:hypothetical protein
VIEPKVHNHGTHLTKSARQSSSKRVKAYNARHVVPRRIRVSASNDSKMWLRSSSGSLANEPQFDLMFSDPVNALPAGLIPSGCEGSAIATSSSSIWTFAAGEVFSFFEGRGSVIVVFSGSSNPGAMVTAETRTKRCNVFAQRLLARSQTRALGRTKDATGSHMLVEGKCVRRTVVACLPAR